jgi:alkylation response protein AidB-like acyl-CoA dehydrogenase
MFTLTDEQRPLVGATRRFLSNHQRELDRITECRRLQRMLYDAGLAGICVPREYGGLGLTPAHQDAFNTLIADYD